MRMLPVVIVALLAAYMFTSALHYQRKAVAAETKLAVKDIQIQQLEDEVRKYRIEEQTKMLIDPSPQEMDYVYRSLGVPDHPD